MKNTVYFSSYLFFIVRTPCGHPILIPVHRNRNNCDSEDPATWKNLADRLAADHLVPVDSSTGSAVAGRLVPVDLSTVPVVQTDRLVPVDSSTVPAAVADRLVPVGSSTVPVAVADHMVSVV